MKPSELLRVAADVLFKRHSEGGRIARRVGCCSALVSASHIFNALSDCKSLNKANEYLDLFRPQKNDSMYQAVYWFGFPGDNPATDERIMCLLFAAAIAKSDGN